MYGGILYIIEKIKVNNIIIGKQFEYSENLEQFLQILKEKNIKVDTVEAGNKINIENNIYFDVFWPNSKNIIDENSINNNSLVCKLYYNNFTMLFTGDIEKVAERQILEKINNDLLRSTILKVAHHGSNTSSTEQFINVVKPNLAIIGVGENNKFKHPSNEIIQRLENIRCKSL